MPDRRSVTRTLALAAAVAAVAGFGPMTAGAELAPPPPRGADAEGFTADRAAYADAQISMDRVVVPMVFPVVGGVSYSDTFLACRSGCTRKHFGQDLMGPRMRPLVATFHGQVSSLKRESYPGEGNYVTIQGDNGWSANYLHVNNDTPGTDDGRGTAAYAFAPGLRVGQRVVPGQLLGWLGDSGNAEGTAPHLHFELRRGGAWSGVVYNAYASLNAAQRIAAPRVSGPHADGTLLRADTGGPTWLVEKGRKRLVTPAVLALNGWTPAQVLVVSRAEVDWYPRHWDLSPRDGLVLKGPDGMHWVTANSRRVALPTPADLALTGVKASRIRPVDAATLKLTWVADAGTEVPTALRPGALVRRHWDTKIYYVANGSRHWVPDVTVMRSWGWTFDDVIPVPVTAFDDVDDVELFPEGEPVPVRDGTVLRHHTRGWLWIMAEGEKRFVTNTVAYRQYGYTRYPQLLATPETLNRQDDGPTFP